jgi:hypothetical protein
VTGWLFANACSQPGMVAIGTNAEDRNVSGKIQISPNACTDSSSPMASPVNAEIQAMATPNKIPSATIAMAGTTPFENRNPTAYPTARTIRIVTVIRRVSATSRPARTAERAIGIARSRSMTPFFSSWASAMAVPKQANAAV